MIRGYTLNFSFSYMYHKTNTMTILILATGAILGVTTGKYVYVATQKKNAPVRS